MQPWALCYGARKRQQAVSGTTGTSTLWWRSALWKSRARRLCASYAAASARPARNATAWVAQSRQARVSAACVSWTRPMWWWAWMNGTLWSLRRSWQSCCSPLPTAKSVTACCAIERVWTEPVTSTADQKFKCSWGLAMSPFQVWSALRELCCPTEHWAVSGLVLNCWWATLFVLFDVVCLVFGSPGPWACDHYRTKLFSGAELGDLDKHNLSL